MKKLRAIVHRTEKKVETLEFEVPDDCNTKFDQHEAIDDQLESDMFENTTPDITYTITSVTEVSNV